MNEKTTFDDVDSYCRSNNIHMVCFLCKKSCKQPYTHWSTMPPDIYCDEFEESEFVIKDEMTETERQFSIGWGRSIFGRKRKK